MSAATKPIPFACMLKPQADSRRVTGCLATHAPIEPVERQHLRFVMWFGVRPVSLTRLYISSHQDSGVPQERAP